MADLLGPLTIFLAAAAVAFGFQRRQRRQRVTLLLEQIASIPLVVGGAYFLHLMMARYWVDYAEGHPPVSYLLVGAAAGWMIGITVTVLSKNRSRR